MTRHGGAAAAAPAVLRTGVRRLLTENDFAQRVEADLSKHLVQHSTSDALSRCRALNAFLATGVRVQNSNLHLVLRPRCFEREHITTAEHSGTVLVLLTSAFRLSGKWIKEKAAMSNN
jgi:hypothetical protein